MQACTNVNPANVGKTVEIVAVFYPEIPAHARMIGKIGKIVQAIKSRNQYKLDMHEGGTWDAAPQNIKILTD